MKYNKVFKIIWSIVLILSIIEFLVNNIFLKNRFEWYEFDCKTDYLKLFIIEIINILFGVKFFSNKEILNKRIIAIYLLFCVIIFFIPIYHRLNYEAPTGLDSETMCLEIIRHETNIYGIDIINLIEKNK